MAIEKEIAFFEAHRRSWLDEHEGKFALIKGAVVSFFDTDEEAFEAGLRMWGDVPMLIKQVLREDRTEGSLSLMYGLINANN